MKYFNLVIAIGLFVATTLPITSILAYHEVTCTNGNFVRWSGQSATFDYVNGSFPAWWQSEIIKANAVWDASSVGADFDFIDSSGSSNDWYKQTNQFISDIGLTDIVADPNTCNLTEVDTWFNTRYNFDICNPSNSGTYDVRTVAIHEFGHWLVLDDIGEWRIWDNDCAMYEWHGTDHTLCDHDIDAIQTIYN